MSIITEQALNAAVDEVLTTTGPGHAEYEAALKLTAENPWLWNGFTQPISESTLAAAMQMGLLLGLALARNGVTQLAEQPSADTNGGRP